MKVAEIVGAKSELWTRFLPSAISDWSHADQSEYEPPSNIREIVETWLETSKETILRLLPDKLKCTTRGEDLSSLRTSLETSIAPSSRDATQEWFLLISGEPIRPDRSCPTNIPPFDDLKPLIPDILTISRPRPRNPAIK